MTQRNRALRRWARFRQPRPRPWWVPLPAGGINRQTRMSESASWTLEECLVSEDWRDTGHATVVMVRKSEDGRYAAAGFLVDLSCLGIKCAIGEVNVDEEVICDLLELMSIGEHLIRCDALLAAKIVHTGHEYGEALGFETHEDYHWAAEILGGIDEAACAETIPTGQNGKPLFLAEPGDDLGGVVAHLEAQLGPDGFLFIAPLGTTPQA